MIRFFVFLFFIFSTLFSDQINSLNSIFYSSNSPRVNSLSGCIFPSDNIGDVFNNPSNYNFKSSNEVYSSFYGYLNNSVNVFQLAYNISSTSKHKINIGFVSRVINNNYNTVTAYTVNANAIDYEYINYENIYEFTDSEVGFLISYDKILGSFIFNSKIKSSIHSVNNDKAFGLGFDFYINRQLNDLNFIFGLKDVFFKKWDSDNIERYNVETIFGFSFQKGNLFSVFNIDNYNTKFGIEYNMFENFFLRLGYDKYNKHSYGFGIKMILLDLNYSYFQINDLSEDVNQFSISFNF